MSALETHGTGTALGDPIEVGAAVEVIQEYHSQGLYTAVKASLSHMEAGAAGAGVLSLLSVVFLHA